MDNTVNNQMGGAEMEKKEWMNKMKSLVKQVANLSPEAKAEFSKKAPILTCEGRVLSGFNQIFLQMQSPVDLTIVAGYRQWKKASRFVSKGQKAAGYIYVPMLPKKKDDAAVTVDPEDVRFLLVPVFDISQTEELQTAVAA
jgi:hypothetical protein